MMVPHDGRWWRTSLCKALIYRSRWVWPHAECSASWREIPMPHTQPQHVAPQPAVSVVCPSNGWFLYSKSNDFWRIVGGIKRTHLWTLLGQNWMTSGATGHHEDGTCRLELPIPESNFTNFARKTSAHDLILWSPEPTCNGMSSCSGRNQAG